MPWKAAEVRVSRGRRIVIPRRLAEELGLEEGRRVLIEVREGMLIVKPLPDAIDLALRGDYVAEVSLEEIEEVSREEQERVRNPESLHLRERKTKASF